jgi:hypothetical protein
VILHRDYALEDRIRVLVAAALAGAPARRCLVCRAVLPPGYAAPLLDPEAKTGPGPEWLCLDERGCDVRWAARARARLRHVPVGPARLLLRRVLDMSAPERIPIGAPRG